MADTAREISPIDDINNEVEVTRIYEDKAHDGHDANEKNLQVLEWNHIKFNPANNKDKITESTDHSTKPKEGTYSNEGNDHLKSADIEIKKALSNQDLLESISKFGFDQNSKSETKYDEKLPRKKSLYQEEKVIEEDNSENSVNKEFVQDSLFSYILQEDASFVDEVSTRDNTDLVSENSIQSIPEPIKNLSSKNSKKHCNRSNEGIEEKVLKEDYSCIRRRRISQNEYVCFMLKKNEFPHRIYFVCWESFASGFWIESVWAFPISFVLEGVLYQDDPGKRTAILKAFETAVWFRDKPK